MTDKELEKIYNEGYRAVYWTAMQLLKSEADAEDVVQDTFVALIESYDTINDAYLKANDQFDGTQSYGRMVDLLLAEYRYNNGLE